MRKKTPLALTHAARIIDKATRILTWLVVITLVGAWLFTKLGGVL